MYIINCDPAVITRASLGPGNAGFTDSSKIRRWRAPGVRLVLIAQFTIPS